MSKWVYIKCEVPGGEDPPSFRHLFVDAEDTDAAYHKGMRLGETAGWFNVKIPFNDYVVEIG